MVGRRQHAGKPGSSLVRAGCALHLHRPADLPAARREGPGTRGSMSPIVGWP